MVIQIHIEGELEKKIDKLLKNEYSYMNKKSFIIHMVRLQVAIEEEIRNEK